MSQREVWDTIADSWSNLRIKPDQEVTEFARDAEGLTLDVGCGNCRQLLPFLQKGLKCVGVDFSKSMIKQAKKFLAKRKFKVDLVIADVSNLPFKNDSFSDVLYVRTLSSVETKESRLKSLEEVKRVSNRALITAWKKWHLKFLWDTIKNRFSSNIYLDWKYHGKVYKRFYHKYTKNELESELKGLGFKIEKIWENEEGNICAVVT